MGIIDYCIVCFAGKKGVVWCGVLDGCCVGFGF